MSVRWQERREDKKNKGWRVSPRPEGRGEQGRAAGRGTQEDSQRNRTGITARAGGKIGGHRRCPFGPTESLASRGAECLPVGA